jgi:hypothetical protein
MFKNVNKWFGAEDFISRGLFELYDKGEISEIDESNKPFYSIINPVDLGVGDLAVESKYFQYKDKHLGCSTKKMGVYRYDNLNKSFNDLSMVEREPICKLLETWLRTHDTHVYRVHEFRYPFMVSGYVDNRISYVSESTRVGF